MLGTYLEESTFKMVKIKWSLCFLFKEKQKQTPQNIQVIFYN